MKSADEFAVELEVASRMAQWCKAKYLPLHNDFSKIDGVLYRRHVVAFLEIKGCSKPFRHPFPCGGWAISRNKVFTARDVSETFGAPCLICVRFACGAIAWIDPNKTPFRPLEKFGRTDRGRPNDIEIGACFDWSDFRILPTVP